MSTIKYAMKMTKGKFNNYKQAADIYNFTSLYIVVTSKIQ